MGLCNTVTSSAEGVAQRGMLSHVLQSLSLEDGAVGLSLRVIPLFQWVDVLPRVRLTKQLGTHQRVSWQRA